MSALAQILRARGYEVSGSDRSYDQGDNFELFRKLSSMGISLFAQDGKGLEGEIDRVVVSNSIEEDNPDLIQAHQKEVPIITRAQLLSELTNTALSVAGTSGKTTTCGMIGYVLHHLGHDPTIINGGTINNLVSPDNVGNAINGHPDLVVFEADESDGSVVLYRPEIGVLTNIELDHKPIKDLEELFNVFLENTKEILILNADCPKSLSNGKRPVVTFGLKNANVAPDEYKATGQGLYFKLKNTPFRLNLIGFHNLLNALAAITALRVFGLKDKEISQALEGFKGIKRRLEWLGQARGIKVFDDYAHNPDKIQASILALKDRFKKLIIIFQPHGFSPTRFLKNELIETFKNNLREKDILFMCEIYYAGGTAAKDISSRDIILPLQEEGKRASYYSLQEEIIDEVVRVGRSGDGILVMGARDETLREFSIKIINRLQNPDDRI